MPNFCANKLTITGSLEELRRFQHMVYTKTETTTTIRKRKREKKEKKKEKENWLDLQAFQERGVALLQEEKENEQEKEKLLRERKRTSCHDMRRGYEGQDPPECTCVCHRDPRELQARFGINFSRPDGEYSWTGTRSGVVEFLHPENDCGFSWTEDPNLFWTWTLDDPQCEDYTLERETRLAKVLVNTIALSSDMAFEIASYVVEPVAKLETYFRTVYTPWNSACSRAMSEEFLELVFHLQYAEQGASYIGERITTQGYNVADWEREVESWETRRVVEDDSDFWSDSLGLKAPDEEDQTDFDRSMEFMGCHFHVDGGDDRECRYATHFPKTHIFLWEHSG